MMIKRFVRVQILSIAMIFGVCSLIYGCGKSSDSSEEPKGVNASSVDQRYDQVGYEKHGDDQTPAVPVRIEQQSVKGATVAMQETLQRHVKEAEDDATRERAQERLRFFEEREGELLEWLATVEQQREAVGPGWKPKSIPTIFPPESVPAFLPAQPESDQRDGDDAPVPDGQGQSAFDDEAFRQMLSVGAAVYCYANPPACPFVMMFMNSLNLGGATRENVQLLQDISKVGETGEISPKLMERMKMKLDEAGAPEITRDVADAYLKYQDLLNNVEESGSFSRAISIVMGNPEMQSRVRERLPTWALQIKDSAMNGVDPKLVCGLLPADDNGPYFENERVKEIARQTMQIVAQQVAAAGGPTNVMERYWDTTLSKVGFKNDASRDNPCE